MAERPRAPKTGLRLSKHMRAPKVIMPVALNAEKVCRGDQEGGCLLAKASRQTKEIGTTKYSKSKVR